MEHQDGGNCSGAAALRQCPFFQVGCPQRQVCIFADVHLFCISDTMFVVKWQVSAAKILWGGVHSDLSYALKNTANQSPGLPLHILQYASINLQRVVFDHSTFPSLLMCVTVYLGPFEDFSKILQTFSDHVQKFFRWFFNTSKDFRKKTSEN